MLRDVAVLKGPVCRMPVKARQGCGAMVGMMGSGAKRKGRESQLHLEA